MKIEVKNREAYNYFNKQYRYYKENGIKVNIPKLYNDPKKIEKLIEQTEKCIELLKKA